MRAPGPLAVRQAASANDTFARELAAFKHELAHAADGALVSAGAELSQVLVAGMSPKALLPRGEGHDGQKEPAGGAGPIVDVRGKPPSRGGVATPLEACLPLTRQGFAEAFIPSFTKCVAASRPGEMRDEVVGPPGYAPR